VGVVLPQPIQFGKYTLFERIGRGGMADVFKGRVQGPAGFERVFVVKRILPHLSDDPQFTRMFIEEAKMSARLNHPNIVQVFELGAVDKEYFIAMEYVRGRDLAETMRTLWARIGPPRPELVAYIGREMCRALAYAHDLTGDDGEPLGMIHRDVSPSNVMLSYEGAVKLLDFGIAKALGGEKEESGTQRGTLKGKFAYMAPEQTQGNDVDRRIDIFATGIVLHEILTGRRLFKGENDLQTVERVRVCDVAPPSLQNPLCPPELDAIVLRALSRNRDERFQSSSEMADALDDVVHAARFQPGHLSMLMRDLFPTDAGGPGARVTTTMSGTQSRPISSGVRSPTIPPMSVPRHSPSRPSIPRMEAMPTPPPHRGFFARGSTWAALALGITGVGVGVFITRNDAPVALEEGNAPERNPLPKKFEIAVRSIPDGASIYLAGENRFLGTTDTYLPFQITNDAHISLVFKKEGYQDETREVSPYPMLVQMKPLSDEEKRERARAIKQGKITPTPPPPHIDPSPEPITAPVTGPGSAAPAPAPSAPPAAAVRIAPAPTPAAAPPSPAPPTTTSLPPRPASGAATTAQVTPPPVIPPPLPTETAPPPPRERPRARRQPSPNDLVSPF
jgi:serine/threonine protein kinase